jgi:carboxyl-terminal processing protease
MRQFLLGVLFVPVAIVSFAAAALADKDSNTYELLQLFGEVFQRVRTDYVEPVKDSDLIENAINGMLTSLDPHSSYMNEKSFKDMQITTKGEFGGLGIEVTMENGLVKVVSPIDDTPAAKAGVQPGDFIAYIDDEPVMGMTLADAVDKMRGAVGTKVKISVLREGASEPIDFPITRAVIKIQAVKSRREGDIAYIRVTSFNEQTFDKLKEEFEKQQKAIGKVRGLVLDLRNNPGGLLDQAVSVSDAFLDHGEIVSTRGRDPQAIKRYTAHAGDITGGVPIVVLINAGSASASEIVAGALQDHKRAIIMGTKSFGKGSVQTVIPLDGHGAMRLTTARYFTPSGHSIQALGITPDIVVEQAKIEPVKKDERMRYEANLKNRLKNAEVDKETLKKMKEAAKDAAARDKGKTGKDDVTDRTSEPGGEIKASEDFQLARALDLLRGLVIYKQQAQE